MPRVNGRPPVRWVGPKLPVPLGPLNPVQDKALDERTAGPLLTTPGSGCGKFFTVPAKARACEAVNFAGRRRAAVRAPGRRRRAGPAQHSHGQRGGLQGPGETRPTLSHGKRSPQGSSRRRDRRFAHPLVVQVRRCIQGPARGSSDATQDRLRRAPRAARRRRLRARLRRRRPERCATTLMFVSRASIAKALFQVLARMFFTRSCGAEPDEGSSEFLKLFHLLARPFGDVEVEGGAGWP